MGWNMKLAILLGQSEYLNIPPLTACKNDLAVMGKLIAATERFDHILFVDDTYKTAQSAKEEIIDFIELHKNNPIDELFLYFTGHGYFDGNDFLYLWGDFDQQKRRQTALHNSEIDDLLHQCHPDLYVKVVDACNSGVFSLKDTGTIENFFDNTKDSFNKFYFLFSSNSDQNSLADTANSFFSSTFIQAIDTREGKKIRYKDIIDFISDTFEQIGRQTPLFIAKAGFTELFCLVNKNIKKIIQNYYNNLKSYNRKGKEFSTLAEIVKLDAQKYVDFETAKKCLIHGFESVESFKIDKELESCYQKEVSVHLSYDAIPKVNRIAQLADLIAKSDNDVFVTIIYENKIKEEHVPVHILASLDGYQYLKKNEGYKKPENDHKIPIFLESKFEIPYAAIFLTLKTKFTNILNYSFILVPILSRTQIYYFYSKFNYKRIDWDDQEIDPSSAHWQVETFDFDNYVIQTKINRLIQEQFISVILDELTAKFNRQVASRPEMYVIGQAEGARSTAISTHERLGGAVRGQAQREGSLFSR